MPDRSGALDLSALSATDPGTTLHVGRYALHRQIARGGMATIHIARLMGDEGFSRIVAAKRLLPEFAQDPEFVAMFLDEARIASRVHHRNVVPVLDVVNTGDEVVLVQEFVHGVPLHWLLNRARQTKSLVPVDIAISIACQVLAGLQAAHETTDELGAPLHVVHRDVSPQNVMIATDGTARLLDFGVAKSLMAAHVTREGTYKGKLAYSAPEQLRGAAVPQSDIYSLTVLLWELLVGHRMHRTAKAEAELVATIMNGELPTVTEALMAQREWEMIGDEHRRQIQVLDPIIKRGLSVEIEDRFQTATEMEEVLLSLVRPASGTAVAQWLKNLGKEYIDRHDKVLAAEEASWRRTTGGQSAGHRRAHSTTQPLRPGGPRPASVARPDEPAPSASQSLPQAAQSPPQTWPPLPRASLPPQASPRRGPYLLVSLLSVLVIVLSLGIIIVMQGQGEPALAPASAASPVSPPEVVQPPPAPAAAPVEAPRPAATTEPTGTTEAARPAPPPEPAAAAETARPAPTEPATAAETARPAETDETDEPAPRPPTVGPSSDPPRTTSRRSGSRSGSSAKAAAAPQSTKAAPAAPPAEPPPPAKESCNPPYYFEGTKKIFKPACL